MTDPTPAGLPNLAAALAKVQAALPKIERDRTVTIQPKTGDPYSYSYITLANLSEAILPLLAGHGLAWVALPGLGADGKMCVRYQLLHESGEALTGEFPVSGEGGIQMIGGRITYARRYCLAAVVGVAADEDDESRLADEGPRGTAQRAAAPRQRQQPSARATAQRGKPAAASGPPLPGEPDPVTEPQMQKVVIGFDQLGVADRAERLRYSSGLVGRTLGSAKELTKAEASEVIKALAAAQQEDDPFAFLAAQFKGGEQ
jgi:hypothetical protein